MSRAHVAAVLDAVRGSGVRVYDGAVPNNPVLPYVVVYADLGTLSRTTLLAVSDRADVGVQTTAVGTTPEQARWAAERARGALIDARLVVPGRNTFPVTHEESRLILRDDQVDPAVFYAVDLFRLQSTPAPTGA